MTTGEETLLVIAGFGGLGVLVSWLSLKRDAWVPKALGLLRREDKPEGIDEKWEEDQFGEGGRK